MRRTTIIKEAELIEWTESTGALRHGRILIPAATNTSAYKRLFLPFMQIGAQEHPKVVLVAGVHGDEYEGQVALNRLISGIKADSLSKSVWIVPCANPLAYESASRFSPGDDNGNLANAFVTSQAITLTQAIAKSLERFVFSGASLVIDLHSGGTSLMYRPCAILVRTTQQHLYARACDTLDKLGIEVAVVKEFGGSTSFIAGAAFRMGAAYLALELGGGGGIDISTAESIRAGLEKVVYSTEEVTRVATVQHLRTWRSIPDCDYIYAEVDGIFEPAVKLGDVVAKGQTVGWLHQPLEKPGLMRQITFKADGEIVAYRHLAKCRRGDCLIELGRLSQSDHKALEPSDHAGRAADSTSRSPTPT
jgi:predicted deacylase